jgi:hypothetical protein
MRHDWCVASTVTEWSPVGATVAAAIAALASLATVVLDMRRQRHARQPNVSGVATVDPRGDVVFRFTNAGPALAIQLGYSGRDEADDYGGTVGTGHLRAGEKATARPDGLHGTEGKEVRFAWMCLDIDGALHVWGANGARLTMRAYGRRAERLNARQLFEKVYESD